MRIGKAFAINKRSLSFYKLISINFGKFYTLQTRVEIESHACHEIKSCVLNNHCLVFLASY